MENDSSQSHLALAALLAMAVALGPLALDTYLPAFPRIAEVFGASHADVGLTLSTYVLMLGLGQLIGGPLSDRYGRARVLLGGLGIFIAASVMIALAQSLAAMLAWRLVQALGGAWCAVSVPAIVRDHAQGNDAARLFALIGLVMFTAPALAPSIGAAVLTLTDWYGVFVFLAGYAALLAIILKATLFRRTAAPVSSTPVHTLLTNYAAVFRHAPAMRFIGLQGMVFSVMLVFVTHASFIYQEWFALSKSVFSVLMAVNVAGMAAVNLGNRWLLRRVDSARLLRVAVTVQAGAIGALVLAVTVGEPSLGLVVPLIVLAVACMGAIAPNNMANILEFFPTLGGTASAVMGATQFTVAGLVSAASTRFADGTLIPIIAVMGVCAALALLLVYSATASLGGAERESAAA